MSNCLLNNETQKTGPDQETWQATDVELLTLDYIDYLNLSQEFDRLDREIAETNERINSLRILCSHWTTQLLKAVEKKEWSKVDELKKYQIHCDEEFELITRIKPDLFRERANIANRLVIYPLWYERKKGKDLYIHYLTDDEPKKMYGEHWYAFCMAMEEIDETDKLLDLLLLWG